MRRIHWDGVRIRLIMSRSQQTMSRVYLRNFRDMFGVDVRVDVY
jgi:hypothetical protein